MIKLNTLEVAGIGPAVHAMRNPFDSWEKSDTHQGQIGEKDCELSERLSNAGTEHCKHLRMCIAWVEIWAPLYWWKEFDTYRAGVEKLSCSTMHTIAKKPFELDDFAHEHLEKCSVNALLGIIQTLNAYRDYYLQEDDKAQKKVYWWQMIQLLPSSYIQRRTVMASYAALRQIYKQRAGHKLDEWEDFRQWAAGLPEGWMITGKEERGGDK